MRSMKFMGAPVPSKVLSLWLPAVGKQLPTTIWRRQHLKIADCFSGKNSAINQTDVRANWPEIWECMARRPYYFPT